MKNINHLLLFLPALLVSCGKELPDKRCQYEPFAGVDFDNNTHTLIPLHSGNFWIYDDSLDGGNGNLELKSNNLMLYISRVWKIGSNYSVEFNQWLPQLTIFGDSLYTTEVTLGVAKRDCFIFDAFLFRTEDTTYLNGLKTKKIYKSNGTIPIRNGAMDYGFIYEIEGAYKLFINEEIGIIRMELLYEAGKIKRSHTLNNYEIK